MKIEIKVPTNLNEITLGQYQKFLKVSENNPEGNFLNAKMIEIFCGIPLSESYKLKMSSVVSIVDILNDMLSVKPNHTEQFTMNGEKFGFIPDLEEISLGEYIDLDGSIGDWSKMHVAMNVLYRPIKDSKLNRYNIMPYNVKGADRMKDMPLGYAISSLFFFLNLGVELSRDTIHSSLKQTENKDIQEQIFSAKSGDGTAQSMHSLMEILQDLTISLN
tara:strand:+ start:328 stop:981 length:654 start_codon:yes stop_codon:yes gene_type:complete